MSRENDPIPGLDARKIRILQAIVNDYVATSRPVGSERLLAAYDLGCKPATIRNEMAEMADMGYLVQPHTSAGRIPTDRGYRFYVDVLMDPPRALSEVEARKARDAAARAQREVEEIVQQTCRLLSDLTAYPSLATDPVTDGTRLRRVYLTEAGPRHALLVVLLSNGHVEHRLVDLGEAPSEEALARFANATNTLVADRSLSEVEAALRVQDAPPELSAHSGALAQVFSALGQMAQALSERRVFVEGMNHMLRQPEFHDVQRLEALLNALQQHGALLQMLSQADHCGDVTVIIGSENCFGPMKECAVVTTTYTIANRPAGTLGVVGPTRMNYDRAVAAVSLMARSLSSVLTTLHMA